MHKLLAIETSCDETAAAVITLKNKGILPISNVVSSQVKLHKKFGGVVPEVAARAHVQRIGPVVQKALKDAGFELKDIDYIAVTAGPGLVPSLLVGVEYAKALATAAGKGFIPINHMHGHLFSAFINNPELELPSMNLVVSGGHTYLIYLKNLKNFRMIGRTVDDAAGEAFDKVAKMLKLGYPGGPLVSKFVQSGKHDYKFPRPMLHAKNFDFSFAGLKTAVLYKIHNDKLDISDLQTKADICLSFENAAVDVLIAKTIRAAQQFKCRSITLSGGVAANKKLRQLLAEASKDAGMQFYVPEMALCTDNALMIANAAAIQLQNGYKPASTASKIAKARVNPNLEI